MPFKVGTRRAEKFKLHLLKLARSECEVTGCNLVSERLTHLTDTERYLLAARSLNALEVYKNTLRRFGAEINNGRRVLCNALERLEHKVKLTNICEVMLAALGAYDVMLVYIFNHLFLAPAVNGDVLALLVSKVLYKLVRSVARLTFLTVHKRIGKAAYVT